MNRILKLAFALALVTTASVTPAQTRSASPSYLSLRLGAVVPQHDDLEGYDNGFAFEAAFGTRLSRNFAVEAAVGRYAVDASARVLDPDFGEIRIEDETSAIPLTGTLKAILPTQSVDFYGLVGAGLYIVSSEYSETYPGFGTDVWEDDALALGLHFGGGMSAHLTRSVSVGAEVKYVVAEAELYDFDTGLDSLLVGATLDFAF